MARRRRRPRQRQRPLAGAANWTRAGLRRTDWPGLDWRQTGRDKTGASGEEATLLARLLLRAHLIKAAARSGEHCWPNWRPLRLHPAARSWRQRAANCWASAASSHGQGGGGKGLRLQARVALYERCRVSCAAERARALRSSVCLPARPPVCPSVRLSVRLSACPPVRPAGQLEARATITRGQSFRAQATCLFMHTIDLVAPPPHWLRHSSAPIEPLAGRAQAQAQAQAERGQREAAAAPPVGQPSKSPPMKSAGHNRRAAVIRGRCAQPVRPPPATRRRRQPGAAQWQHGNLLIRLPRPRDRPRASERAARRASGPENAQSAAKQSATADHTNRKLPAAAAAAAEEAAHCCRRGGKVSAVMPSAPLQLGRADFLSTSRRVGPLAPLQFGPEVDSAGWLSAALAARLQWADLSAR